MPVRPQLTPVQRTVATVPTTRTVLITGTGIGARTAVAADGRGRPVIGGVVRLGGDRRRPLGDGGQFLENCALEISEIA